MMLFGERIPLDSKNQVEDNMFVVAWVSKEVEETQIELEAKKETHKGKTNIGVEVEKDARHEKALIAEKKLENQCVSIDVFKLIVDFECIGKQDSYE